MVPNFDSFPAEEGALRAETVSSIRDKPDILRCMCTESEELLSVAASQRISTPTCEGLVELPTAPEERASLNRLLSKTNLDDLVENLLSNSKHIALGLALTVGSAVGERPPSESECLDAFLLPNSAGLTAGARAWSKHAPRSERIGKDAKPIAGWWGTPKGPIAVINAQAMELFYKVMKNATWRNLHWLPHGVLVYEIRVHEGYGMRWSRDRKVLGDDIISMPWIFRGYVEPMMERGHEEGWRH